jgi:hypothetical protein
MRCTMVNFGGVRTILCGRGARVRYCTFCRSISEKLCDFPASKKKTCDKPLCRGCAISIAPNVDLCPDHPLPAGQLVLELPSF